MERPDVRWRAGNVLWIGSSVDRLAAVVDQRERPPGLFALYVSLYCFGRFWVEALRVDPAHHIGGLRLNDWVAGILFVVSTAFFVWWQWRARKRERAGIVDPKRPAMAVPRSRVR